MQQLRAPLFLAQLGWLVLICMALATGCKTTGGSEEQGDHSSDESSNADESNADESNADESNADANPQTGDALDNGEEFDEGFGNGGGGEQANLFADDGSDESFEQFLGQDNSVGDAWGSTEAPTPMLAPSDSTLNHSASAANAAVANAPVGPMLASASVPPPLSSAQLISSDFAGAPPLSGSRRTMAQGEAPEEYIVEAGDTLIDICDQLLSEPGYWPKLWALNSYIKNPHFIWPGMRLRFYPGDDQAPPFLEVVTEEEFLPPGEGTSQMLAELVKEAMMPEFKKESIVSPPIIGLEDIGSFEAGIEVRGEVYAGNLATVTLPGFILKEQPAVLCEVQAGSSGESDVGPGIKFLCALPEEGSGAEAGMSYTALRYVGEVADEEGEVRGHHYEFVAQVKLEAKVDNQTRGLGIITESRDGLRKGDQLVSFMPSTRVVNLSRHEGASANTAAKIVALEGSEQLIAAQGHMIFLDKGRNDGVQAGQLYPIQQNMQHDMHVHTYADSPDYTSTVGYARIIDATEVGAVAYIIYSTGEIYRGDRLGKG